MGDDSGYYYQYSMRSYARLNSCLSTVVGHLRSSSYRTLAVPRTRTTLGDRSFAVAGPRVWNSLPAAIRQITGYGQFRQHLKTQLFRLYTEHHYRGKNREKN